MLCQHIPNDFRGIWWRASRTRLVDTECTPAGDRCSYYGLLSGGDGPVAARRELL